MITKVQLQNFKSHEDTLIEFHQGAGPPDGRLSVPCRVRNRSPQGGGLMQLGDGDGPCVFGGRHCWHDDGAITGAKECCACPAKQPSTTEVKENP